MSGHLALLVTTTLALCSSLGAGLSTPLPPPPHPRQFSTTFSITNLTAKAETLSHRVEYSLLVQADPSQAPVLCSALVTNLNESLANVSLTSCGTPDAGLAFGWCQFNDGHAELRVVHTLATTLLPAVRETGVHVIGSEEIALVANGTQFEHQMYVGPANFTMEATRSF